MSNKIAYTIIAIILVIVLGFACFHFWHPKTTGELPQNLTDKWQAVFLSDGQVYFGHLTENNKKFYQLTNIYYLKYGTKLQQDQAGDGTSSDQNLGLIKLGAELHAPEDVMYIDKDKVEFIENLKATSPVVKAMEKIK